MVLYLKNTNSHIGEIKYVNLKTGLMDDNYDFKYNLYYNDKLYFINK